MIKKMKMILKNYINDIIYQLSSKNMYISRNSYIDLKIKKEYDYQYQHEKRAFQYWKNHFIYIDTYHICFNMMMRS